MGHDQWEGKKDDTSFSFSFKIFCGFIGNAVDLVDIEILIINAKYMCLNKLSQDSLVRSICLVFHTLQSNSEYWIKFDRSKNPVREVGQVESFHLTECTPDFQRV